LILHGLLHLAGYDHESDAGRMARRELALRARLGLPQGLIERAGSVSASRQVSKPARPRRRDCAAEPWTRSLPKLARNDGAIQSRKRVRT
jgi:probable rRNA maturation factor